MVDSAESSPPIDPIIAARYASIERLAAEGSDPRYLAQRVDTGALVELRVISGDGASDDTLLRALRDLAARAAAVSAQHLPIATVLECDRTSDGKLVITMDQPRGPTLRDTLKDTIRREGTLPLERALQFALRIAEALESAHNVGLIHGGLRPENVVVAGPEPTITLVHFGVDRLLSRSTGWNERAATPYQAPEQASGETSERSDIYALGAVLYEMLGGTPPPAGAASRRRIEPRAWKTRRGEISAGLERLITKSLEVVPAERPPYMSVVCNDLADAVNLDRRRKRARETSSGPRPRARLALFIGCITLGVIGALAVSFGHPRLTFVTSALWKLRSEPASTSPPAPPTPPSSTSASDPVPDKNVEAGRVIGEAAAPRSRTPAVRPPAEGVRQGDTRPIPRPPRDTTSPPLGTARSARSSDRVESVPPRANIAAEPARPAPPAANVTEPPLPGPPVRPRPSAPEARDDTEDPGAIIDWLLESGRTRR